jgi:4-hydroxy-3-polyprenylbenzoate decarboxylase
MLGLARQGAVVLPANPGFYHEPDSVEAIVDFIVARVLDQLGIPQDLMNPWGRVPEEASRGSSSADP